ncbi:CdaR family protein, partial [Staphylococcus aureus]
ISEVDAEVDLDGISESTEKTVKINLPEHVTKAQPSETKAYICLLYTSPSPRDTERSRMPSSA